MIKLNAIFKKKNVLKEGDFAYKRKRKGSIMKWLLLLIIVVFLFGLLFENSDEDNADEDGVILNRHQNSAEVKILKREVKIETNILKKNTIEVKKIAQVITPRIEYLDKVLRDSQKLQQ